MFRAGAFNPLPGALSLNLQHDPQRVIASLDDGLTLQDDSDALRLSVELREGSAELELTRRGALNGLSVEFHALAESRQDGVRIIGRAALAGVALVDQPSYLAYRIELRRRLTTLRGVIDEGVDHACECQPGDCTSAIFEQNALTSMLRDDAQRDLLAVAGNYRNALASRRMKTLRLWRNADGGLEYAVYLPDTQAARDLLQQFESVPVYGRPIIDTGASTWTKQGTAAHYSQVTAKGLLIGATDAFIQSLGATASARVELEAPGAPQGIRNEAMIRLAAYLRQLPAASNKISAGTFEIEPVTNHAGMFRNCGVPAGMFEPKADGTAQREALRRWFQNLVLSLARMVEYELTLKFETEVKLKFDNYALDMVSRAQVVEKLTRAGIDRAAAMAAVSLDDI